MIDTAECDLAVVGLGGGAAEVEGGYGGLDEVLGGEDLGEGGYFFLGEGL